MSATNRNRGLDLQISKSDLRDLKYALDRIRDQFTAKGANTQINKLVYRASKPMRMSAKSQAPVDKTGVLKKKTTGWRTKSGVRVGANYKGGKRKGGWYVHLATYPHKVGTSGAMTKKSSPYLADAFNATKGIVAKNIIDEVKKFLKW
tara:strand:- start:320 stop:763 length:444 start_codon:yes stop_codon:yes gene_type:complete